MKYALKKEYYKRSHLIKSITKPIENSACYNKQLKYALKGVQYILSEYNAKPMNTTLIGANSTKKVYIG